MVRRWVDERAPSASGDESTYRWYASYLMRGASPGAATHLARMNDFWSAALLRTGRYSGRPVEQHRSIDGLGDGHFGRWVELFEATTSDLCTPRQADAFNIRARRMREGMTKVLRLDG